MNLHAIEQMQLRERRRVDGVGRPKFDVRTGPEAQRRHAAEDGRGAGLHPAREEVGGGRRATGRRRKITSGNPVSLILGTRQGLAIVDLPSIAVLQEWYAVESRSAAGCIYPNCLLH